MSDKIEALNPDPSKESTNIDRDKYDIIKSAILSIVEEERKISFGSLMNKVKGKVTEFDGSVSWYYTTVKLDLEARGILKVSRSGSTQQIELGEKK